MGDNAVTEDQLKGQNLKSTKTHVADAQKVDPALVDGIKKNWKGNLDDTMKQECYNGINWKQSWVEKTKALGSEEEQKTAFAEGVATGLAFAE